jgi:hypothetical protein
VNEPVVVTRYYGMRTIALCLVLAFTLTRAALADPAQLANDRAAQAAKVYTALVASPVGATPEDLYRWSVRWLDAQLDAQPKAAAKAFAEHAKRMTDLEAKQQAAYKAAIVDANALAMATYYRIEADLWVARGKK